MDLTIGENTFANKEIFRYLGTDTIKENEVK